MNLGLCCSLFRTFFFTFLTKLYNWKDSLRRKRNNSLYYSPS